MQRLTALDSMYVAMDTETTNAILGGLLMLEPSEDGRVAPDEDFMRARLAERLAYLPPLSRKVIKSPLGVLHDYLGEPARIDLDAHVGTLSLPAPGTQEQLAAEVSRLMSSTELPADRPLWHLTVIKGLQDGSVALLLRIHHLVVDGGSMPVVWDLLQDTPKGPMVPEAHPYAQPRFGSPEMVAREIAGMAQMPVDLAKLAVGAGGWVLRTLREKGPLALAATPLRLLPGELTGRLTPVLNRRLKESGSAEVAPYLPTLSPPAMPFNGRVTARRTFVFADLPLADLRRVGKLLGGTINDAVLGVTAGAMRRYLQDRNLPVDKPLIVNIPVSIRTGKEKVRWANYVMMVFAEYPVHLADPVARVRAASRAVKAAKASFDALPIGLIPAASKFLPPALITLPMRLMVKSEAMSKVPYNVVVSNVRGPAEPEFIDGVKVKGVWPASFLSVGGGINITLQSYCDRMCFGFMGSPEQAVDLQPLVRYMQESLAETLAAAQAATSAPAPSPRPGRRPGRPRGALRAVSGATSAG
ncbi:MAG: wax ester/triacylglycerol synthase domain-containing protein [Dermatophilaceae bacterium]